MPDALDQPSWFSQMRCKCAIMIELAHAAARTKRSYYTSMYHRIAARRGKKRAAVEKLGYRVTLEAA